MSLDKFLDTYFGNKSIDITPERKQVEATTQHPFNAYNDRFGRKILDKQLTFYFRDGEILARGFIKKELPEGKHEFVSIDHYEMPIGWYRRKEYDFFYQPNSHNIMNILYAKRGAQMKDIIKFSDSFCIFIDKKIKEAVVADDALNKVKDLTLDDEEKIKALPDIYEKRVPDFLHQKIASQYAYYLPQCGLLEEQGLGKTKTAIETFVARKEYGLVDRCLVIGPKSVIGRKGWIKQINEYAPTDYKQALIRGTKEQKLEVLDGDLGEYDFYLINYEGMPAIEDELLSWVDDRTMIILDESSKIKNFYAVRSKLCAKLGQLTPYKLILTGTPITQGGYDIFSQFYFLDGGDEFGQSYDSFLKRYFNSNGFKKEPKRYALDEIHEKIFRKCVRFTKDVLKDLPDKTYQMREVTMTPLQKKYYEAVRAAEMIRLSELEKVDANNILVTIMRLQQITSGYVSPKDLNDVKLAPRPIEPTTPKLTELMEIIDEIDDKSQIIIWSRFRFDIDRIYKALEAEGITAIQYVGGMSELQREKVEADFLEGRARCFVSNPQAGGMGMNLQCASHMIYYSNNYSLQDRLQSEDRAHRIGQKKNLNIIDIVCDATIDETVLQVLTDKKEVADIVTGDQWKEFLFSTPGIGVHDL